MTCKECAKQPPHYGARYVFSCIGCYARWICDAYNTPDVRRSAIEGCKHHAVDDLKAAVIIEYGKRKK